MPGHEMTRVDTEKVAEAVRQLLKALGVDLEEEGLRETPERVARMLEEMLSGYREEVEPVTFTEAADLVVMAGIPFASLCEHHLLPFVGLAHIAYRPRGRVLGASKLVRIVRKYAHRLQLQERLTSQILKEVSKLAGTADVMVVTEAFHTCMVARGVRTASPLIVVRVSGAFASNDRLVDRVLALIAPYRLRIPLFLST